MMHVAVTADTEKPEAGVGPSVHIERGELDAHILEVKVFLANV
jgi:hypothetical protein